MSINKHTGNWNTGDGNTGYWNTGDGNTGDRNTGDGNTGNWNTGDGNTGNWNTGDWNTGNWNTGDWNTGYFCQKTPDAILVFDEPCSREEWNECYKPDFLYFDTTEWVGSSNMTDSEKEEHPSHTTTGGFLRKYDYKEAFQKSWAEADKEDRIRVKEIPNFDAEKFFQISGIRVDEEPEELTLADVCKLLGREVKIRKV
jgi:hypothetical protein